MQINFPDQARLWIYAADRPLSDKESEQISQKIKQFAQSWQSHGTPMVADAFVLHNQFVLLIADETHVATGGCSMDASVHFIKEIGALHGVDFFNRMLFHSYQNGKVITYDKETLDEAYRSDDINEETLFFNPLVKTYGDYKREWMVPLGKSWVKRFIPQASISQ